MTAAADVLISAASADAATAGALASALSAEGIATVAATDDLQTSAAVSALESCRALVVVLSAAANSSTRVIRELERATGRGVPIITYAIEDVGASPAVAYFIDTASPIAAWRPADPQLHIRMLVQATTRALGSRSDARPAIEKRAARARLSYRDSRTLERTVSGVLIGVAIVSAYALYRDMRFLLAAGLGIDGAPPAFASTMTAADIVSVSALWGVLLTAIACLRRARTNLLGLFVSPIRLGAGEITWRAVVPLANGVWLARMARQLRQLAELPSQPAAPPADLSRPWGASIVWISILPSIRDLMYTYSPEGIALITATSVALGVGDIVAVALTYSVVVTLLVAVRKRHDARQVVDVHPRPSESAAAARDVDVLVIYVPADEATARSVAGVLERVGCRCWHSRSHEGGALPASAVPSPFAAALPIVSQASHRVESVAAAVQSAIAARMPVVPFVVDAPPSGSALGYYIRSLQWIDGTAGVASLPLDRVRSALTQAAAHAGVDHPTPPGPHEDGAFARLSGSAVVPAHYRPARLIRLAALTAAAGQVIAAAFITVIAIGTAFYPSPTNTDGPLTYTAALILASFPAWLTFLPWLWSAHRNAGVLLISGLGSRGGLLFRVGTPLVSLFAGGSALGRLWRSIDGALDAPRSRDTATLVQLAWMGGGIVWTTAAIVSVILALRGYRAAAMMVSLVQCAVTIPRGALRWAIVRRLDARLEARARGG